MTDREITIETLKRNGYKPKATETLKNYRKDYLIDIIRCLEHNWAVALETSENQYRLLKELTDSEVE